MFMHHGRGYEVDRALQQVLKLPLHRNEVKKVHHRLARIKRHQAVDIAPGPEIASKDGTEKCELLDSMSKSQCGQRTIIDDHPRIRPQDDVVRPPLYPVYSPAFRLPRQFGQRGSAARPGWTRPAIPMGSGMKPRPKDLRSGTTYSEG